LLVVSVVIHYRSPKWRFENRWRRRRSSIRFANSTAEWRRAISLMLNKINDPEGPGK
jgi:hypothetical protein